MAAAFTFLWSENDTLLEAAGKTIAVERKSGVINSETIVEITNTMPVIISNDFLCAQIN
jgi:hypothetical protein